MTTSPIFSEALVSTAMAGVTADLAHRPIRGGLAGRPDLDAKILAVLERQFNTGMHIADPGRVMETR